MGLLKRQKKFLKTKVLLSLKNFLFLIDSLFNSDLKFKKIDIKKKRYSPSFRNSRLRILPITDLGNSGTTSIILGYLNGLIFV